MGCVIDTCILIEAERNSSDIAVRISNIKDDNFYISVITASELLYGIYRAGNVKTKNRRKAFVEDVLLKFPILPNNLPVARMHAELWAELASTGNMIGSHDLWIAAASLAHGHALLTDNKKDFQKIPGLKVV